MSAAKFVREPRYLVVKQKDAFWALTLDEMRILNVLIDKVALARKSWGKLTLQGVFVEHDWPEYEPTWAMIEARMTGPAPAAAAEPVQASLAEAAAPLMRWLNLHHDPHTSVVVGPTSAEVQQALQVTHTNKFLLD